MGELAGEGREGEGERWVRLGGARGAVGGGLGPGCSVLSPCSWLLVVREGERRKEEGEKKREKKRRRDGKKEKEKNGKIF
jgi:hypothetical protein